MKCYTSTVKAVMDADEVFEIHLTNKEVRDLEFYAEGHCRTVELQLQYALKLELASIAQYRADRKNR